MAKLRKNAAARQNAGARRLNPTARRAQLLACAMQVFARRGLGAARHAEVAEVAGMSVATVFVYFPTRELLVRAVLDEVARFIHDDVLVPIQRDTVSAPEVLRESAAAFADSIDRHPDHARVWLDWSTAVRDDVWPLYLEFQERIQTLLVSTTERGKREGSLSADLDSEDAARLLIGAAYMIAQMKIAEIDSARVRHFIESLVAGFLFRPGGGER
ncbi:MAG: TetR/AcrR family transcriptional regulator [Gammaproteobacteria bacterium]|nr:TetR/AcrR family transcriptional regulator [Gammaproteobacteria bacterium]